MTDILDHTDNTTVSSSLSILFVSTIWCLCFS